VRLRRSDCAGPGIRRVRRGRGFSYRYADGSPVLEDDVLERITALVLPPAWQDVWICPWPNGHIQAIGTDAAGRRQYRYHDEWRTRRDAEKHERVLAFARRLPAARRRVAEHLGERGYTRDRVLATAFRLLDLGFFRVGSEEYAEENNTYGLATIRRDHVTVRGDTVVFEYLAKGNKERLQSVVDPTVRAVVRGLLRRDDDAPELLAYRAGGRWRDVKSGDVNDYIRQVVGADVSAKDFRTWHATVLMAVGLAVSEHAPASETARKRAVARAVREVSDYLGNTPAVARGSYIDPRVIDLYLDGVTVAPALERLGADADFGQPATHGLVEAAVLRMLSRAPAAATRRRTTAAGARRPDPVARRAAEDAA
jgi:DNA topoisomerase I